MMTLDAPSHPDRQIVVCEIMKKLWVTVHHDKVLYKFQEVTSKISSEIIKFHRYIERKKYLKLGKDFFLYIGNKINPKNSEIPLINTGDGWVINDKVKCDIFAEQFGSVLCKISAANTFSSINNSSKILQSVYISDFEMYEALKKRSNKINSSPDNIPEIMLKKCALTLSYPLACICRLSLSKGTVPNHWKEAIIRPLYKKNDPHLASNYRPISLTSSVSKTAHWLKSLHIGSNSYPLVCDVPVIEKLSVALSPIVGCPVMPSCDWKSDRPASKVVFDWFVADKLYDLDIIRDASNAPCFSADGWRHVHTGPIFWPSAELSGLYLAVLAHFGDKALAKSTVCPTVIQIPEEPFIFERRQLNYCASPLEDPERIRVVCYNILADLYLNLRLDQDRLFFPYCPKKFQEAGYRYPVILRELKGYSADLICLQEVDFRMQKRFLISFLRDECGLASEFRCSAGPVNEGQLIAYRPSKFRLVESIPSLGRREAETEADRDNGESQSLGSAKNNDKSQEKTNPFQGVRISDLVDFPENEDISRLLDANQEMSQYLRKKATALQIVHLECVCDPSIRLLVLNTHLTFDPAYEHIKLLQAALALRYLTRIQRDVRATLPSKSRVIAIACGDLNSTPTSGVARLFRDGRVDASPENWGLNVGGTGIELNVGAKFTNLAGFPEYTNYTKYSLPNPQNFSVTGLTPTEQNQTGFAGCLDYIWSFPPVRVESVAPMPAHELVIRYTALPSSIAPSDHLPLVCDISLLS